MQLTKLEIKGFKSFADRVIINFDEGITGIVGPNGCGKSNVVDAIRWVLGEQKSRVLRSDKMENVIFNGTKKRKPTQLAEVSLTFDNTKNLIPTEYNQVTITRRYYRSGESEYLLNSVACRLKDITNLFLDTGIASNSYAIIELKMVDDLLNDKDNSRRSLFEEAAGISKFKIRKKETLRKLEDTDADLDRVEDLLFEIEKNLKSLERQATQAKKYYEVKESYKTASIALAKNSLSNQQDHFDEIESHIQIENDKKLTLNALVNEKEAAIVKAKNELILKEKTLSSRQKSLNEHVNKIRQYESEKKIKNERQKFLRDKIESLTLSLKQDNESLERASLSIKGLENELETNKNLFEEIQKELENIKRSLDRQKEATSEAHQAYQEANSHFITEKDRYYQISKEIEIKEIQLKSMDNELKKIQDDTSTHHESIKDFESKIDQISKEAQEKQKNLEDLRQKEDELKLRLEEKHSEKLELTEKLTRTNRYLDARQNEYNLTKSLVDNLEGFPEAIKFLKKNQEWHEAPLLSDILLCPEEYRIAIENYLEPFMNYYIVDTPERAMKAVNLLSDASMGKANFFILDQLGNYPVYPQEEGLKPAIALVEYDAKYEKLIRKLLGNVYLTESSSFKKIDDEKIILERSGKISFRKEQISGGSVGLFEGKRIGRAKNLEKLQEKIKSSLIEKESLKQQLTNLEGDILELSKQTKTEEIKHLESDLNKLKQSLVSVESKKEQFQDLISTSQLRKADIQEQKQQLEVELMALRPFVADGSIKLEEAEANLARLREHREELRKVLEEQSSKYNEFNVFYHQKKNRLESTEREIAFKQESLNNTKDRIARNKRELMEVNTSLSDLVKTTTTSDEELLGLYEEKENLELGVNEAEKAYYEARGLIDREEKHLRETQRTREGIDQSLMDWKNKLNEAKMGLNSIKDRLSVEFNVDLDTIEEDSLVQYEGVSATDLKERVSKLRSRIERMGPINPMAMEAFEEIKERYGFISGQKKDLTDAKESLLTTISEIDEVARETFLEAFDKIKDNFIRVFRALFTDEDDCDLILTDPENPLESTIEIIAKPKGKRPLTINQLSGGEKTLTATSLLFSIYLLKPAPFCIFDEVDAPLDDANIDKFNEIIRKFSKESQFIIVTHNKRTMASTDVIYGVTMQEQGVSKVVPVDLRALA